MPKIIFVCTGNTCRSPMAEHLFRQIIESDPELDENWEVCSAGLFALPGQEASDEAVRVLEEEDIDLTEHRSRRLDRELVDDAGLILTMTVDHKEMIIEQYPGIKDKVFTLKEFAGRIEGLNVSDPFGQSAAVYRQIKDEIKDHLMEILGKTKHFFQEEGKKEETENTYYSKHKSERGEQDNNE